MPVDSWSLVDQEIGQFTKQSFMEKIIAATINKCEIISPKTIVQALIDHSHAVSSRSRAFLENSKGRLPPDHRLYPGKMDHSTCVCFFSWISVGKSTSIKFNTLEKIIIMKKTNKQTNKQTKKKYNKTKNKKQKTKTKTTPTNKNFSKQPNIVII
jgi:hypothetical protein